MNKNPILDLLLVSNFDNETIDYTDYTMSTIIRMPYSNNWRVRSSNARRPYIASDCPSCTVPARSGHLGMQIADYLSEQQGADVFGWDLEWNMNFDGNQRVKYGGAQMFRRLGTGSNSKEKGKVVVLAHDLAFRKKDENEDGQYNDELKTFLEMATSAGYQFRTLDSYYYD